MQKTQQLSLDLGNSPGHCSCLPDCQLPHDLNAEAGRGKEEGKERRGKIIGKEEEKQFYMDM